MKRDNLGDTVGLPGSVTLPDLASPWNRESLMGLSLRKVHFPPTCCALTFIAMIVLFASPAVAEITVGHIDDFQDGTTQDWRIGQPVPFPKNVADSGPQGAGDYSLFTTNTQLGSRHLLVVLNEDNQQFPGNANWEENWTTAGVTQVSFDIRNPGTTLGASDLTMRLGIAGPEGASSFGDVYITDAQIVPPDNTWHSLTFDVRASDFIAVGSGDDVNRALAEVTQFRIFSNPDEVFIADGAPNEFYLDNIRAIGLSATLPGDYNQNGAVDASDYVLWRDTLDQNVTPGTGADGSGPAGQPDGVVNSHDYSFWRAHFGETTATAGTSLISSPLPEPGSWLLFAGFFAAVSRRIGRI